MKKTHIRRNIILIDFYRIDKINKIVQNYVNHFGDASYVDIGGGFTFETINWDKNTVNKLQSYVQSHIDNNIRIKPDKLLDEFVSVPSGANI